MYLVPVTIGKSDIEGMGVFAQSAVKKGEVVWKYVDGHDLTLSQEEYSKLGDEERRYLDKVAYLSKESRVYVYPPENDPALYTNHDATDYNLSVVLDYSISTEPFFVANRDIASGEELTNNYHEFDEAIKSKEIVPGWLI
jgi:uncharacterized protein